MFDNTTIDDQEELENVDKHLSITTNTIEAIKIITDFVGYFPEAKCNIAEDNYDCPYCDVIHKESRPISISPSFAMLNANKPTISFLEMYICPDTEDEYITLNIL